MTLRLSGHSSIIFGLVFMLKSLLENARQRNRESLSYTHDRTRKHKFATQFFFAVLAKKMIPRNIERHLIANIAKIARLTNLTKF